MAKSSAFRPLLLAGVCFGLAGCLNYSALDDLETAPPPDTPFAAALYKDYAFLARSFGAVGQASYRSFDQPASLPLANTEGRIATLANAFADKALQLSRGEVVDPEPSQDIKSHELRDRLVRALGTASDTYPRDAARAQADWDCWRLNLMAPSQASAAEQCRRSFDVTLSRLETEALSVTVAKQAEAKKKAAEKTEADGTNAADDTETP